MSAGKKLLPFQKKARQLFSDFVLINEPLARHTTFKIGGPAQLFFKITDPDLLQKALKFCAENKLKVLIIGKGSDLLFSDKGYNGVILKLEGAFEKIKLMTKNTFLAGAGAPLGKLCFLAQNSGLSGLEWAWGIPATVGGAVASNAGAFGSCLGKIVKRVTVWDRQKNKIKKIPRPQIKFSYRKSSLDKNLIILEAELKLKTLNKKIIENKMADFAQLRKLRQPLEFPSAGSIFKNPPGRFAGQLIENCRLKGKRIGGAVISEKHANFIINAGGAKSADVLKLIKLIQMKVKRKFGVSLKNEIVVVAP